MTRAADTYFTRVEERASEWWVLGPSPYSPFLQEATDRVQADFDKDPNQRGIPEGQYASDVRAYMIAAARVEATKDYLKLRCSTARKVQTADPCGKSSVQVSLISVHPIARRHCTKNTAENPPRATLLRMLTAVSFTPSSASFSAKLLVGHAATVHLGLAACP